MKAWQINDYGSKEVFRFAELPDPQPKAGWILIDIKAFGINRSELYTRQGHSGDAVTLPRVLGIECVGVVRDGGGTDLQPGQKVAAAMGNMGRLYDGGYAEMTLVPRSNVFPVETNLDWETFGALPETYLTSFGAIHKGVDLQPGTSLLIRGGSSAAGLAAISIAKDLDCLVIATTRSQKKAEILKAAGADHVIIDSGNSIVDEVRDIVPQGVAGGIEFVGLERTIMECLACMAPRATLCLVGFLGNSWDYNFFPWMPSTVKLTLYSTETLDSQVDTQSMQMIVDKVEQGKYQPNIHEVFPFEKLPEAHYVMENNLAAGKLVVRTT
ncbi:MAG: zinc-binding dehydrogenase [Bacteroidota bacterium]